MSNHSSELLNKEYAPYVWTGGSGRLTARSLRDRPSWGAATRGWNKKKEKQGEGEGLGVGGEKEKEMSFK